MHALITEISLKIKNLPSGKNSILYGDRDSILDSNEQ